ncbi:VOC family protein [Paenibacillus piri]|uniref:VOC family protein n=1 Tax=Paenibacillus piri TaxID=2547395 RepID=A0A4R5KCT2_9BACL|nr:VOC family protein [Paenibacillus piri]
MWRIVPRIATIEIPVSDLKKSIEWYCRNLGTRVVHETKTDAMLHLQGSNKWRSNAVFVSNERCQQQIRISQHKHKHQTQCD